MYAVIFEKSPIYLGHETNTAIKIFKSKTGSELYKIESLEHLSVLVEENPPPSQSQDQLSDAALRLVKKIEELVTDQDLDEEVYKNPENVIAEVRLMGFRGMKVVGEGFMNPYCSTER